MPHTIGIVIFAEMTQLDITGPHQVFASMPDTRIHLLWKNLEPVRAACGLTVLPTTVFADCPPLDVLLVGGGPGQIQVMNDPEILKFLQQQAANARFITSVCTGSLVLAAAGLLVGYRAACHWAYREQLALLGVEVSTERVVVDRNRITGGGVTAGIDFALCVAAMLCGEQTARLIQLRLEYNPAPPFDAGSPQTAGEQAVAQVLELRRPVLEASLAAVKQVAQRLSQGARAV